MDRRRRGGFRGLAGRQKRGSRVAAQVAGHARQARQLRCLAGTTWSNPTRAACGPSQLTFPRPMLGRRSSTGKRWKKPDFRCRSDRFRPSVTPVRHGVPTSRYGKCQLFSDPGKGVKSVKNVKRRVGENRASKASVLSGSLSLWRVFPAFVLCQLQASFSRHRSEFGTLEHCRFCTVRVGAQAIFGAQKCLQRALKRP